MRVFIRVLYMTAIVALAIFIFKNESLIKIENPNYKTLDKSIKIRDYFIEVKKTELSHDFIFYNYIIYKNGNKIMDIREDLGLDATDGRVNAYYAGKDINHDGEPEIIFEIPNRCYEFNVYTLGKEFKKIFNIRSRGGIDKVQINPFDFNPAAKIKFKSAFYMGDYRCMWCGPNPDLVYAYRNGKYVLAFDLMKERPPSEKVFQEMVKYINSNTQDVEKPFQWFGQLLFSGNVTTAERFVEQIEDLYNKESYLRIMNFVKEKDIKGKGANGH
ncbi:MAG: hypothetical protein CVV21_00890 [Candidatus Goldiibacteriota bacterium HGW-Goldbacteria-1]|nr:MAG: hypothetical protein CVV21_00890 [Candidatus Goldiibacteriota bacterium HGW-Goldbacteria-1]